MKNYTYIYSLACPNTGYIKYIGKTNDLKKRFNRHIFDSRKDTKTHKRAWISGLLSENKTPIIEIIDIVPIKNWQFWEEFYIILFKSWGFSLTNLTNGGECGISTKESINKMVETRRKNNSYAVTNELRQKRKLLSIGNKNPFYGKKHTEKSKQKIGIKSKERNNKKIAIIENNQTFIFNSYEELATYKNVNKATISKRINKNYKNYFKLTKTPMWIKCPLCKGSGLEPIIGTHSNIPICTVCDGHKIISQLTGLPPQTRPTKDYSQNTNYLEIVKPIKPTLNG